MVQVLPSFADMAWLFNCDNRNRGIIRQNFDEAALLWQSVQATKGPILEIGRARGGSTALLVTAGAGRPVTSIDVRPNHHPACDRFFADILAAEPDRLRLMTADSSKPLQGGQFGLIFIDGDHSYEGVRADVIAHWASLQPVDGAPALAVFHDAVPNEGLRYDKRDNHCEGVRQICDELLNAQCARVVKSAGSSLVLEKISELPWEWVMGQAAEAADLQRREDVILLARPGGIGIELGVAEGILSERLLKRNRLSHLYSVDMYAGDRGHDIDQYKRAVSRLMPYRDSNTLLKLRFDQALNLFEDEYFDFIYIDGYAHTNEDEGKTLHDWWPKLKAGGIFAGDDYCNVKWPGVVRVVDDFVARHGLSLHVIDSREDLDYCRYPTWYARKP